MATSMAPLSYQDVIILSITIERRIHAGIYGTVVAPAAYVCGAPSTITITV